jgi:Uma2 family endonuclease
MAVVTTLPFGRPLTRADLAAMPEDGHRYELLDGSLVVTPSPSYPHQDVVGHLHLRLTAACPADLKVLLAPFDVVLAEDTVLIPDLIVARRADFTHRDLPGPPLLAIEVLSPSTSRIDRTLKRARLEAAGCPAYWVVDPLEPSITVWELVEGEYVDRAHVVGSQPVALDSPFHVEITPSELRDPDDPASG